MTEVSMGNGGYAKRILSYKKRSGDPLRQPCTVSGTLTNDFFKQPGSEVTIRKARYVVTGEQTFDSAVKEWVSGRLTMDAENQMVTQDKTFGSIKAQTPRGLKEL